MRLTKIKSITPLSAGSDLEQQGPTHWSGSISRYNPLEALFGTIS